MSDRKSSLTSWVKYSPENNFSIQNIPFGVFQKDGKARCCSRIGDFVIDLSVAAEQGVVSRDLTAAFSQGSLNDFMAMGRPAWRKVREDLQKAFSAASTLDKDESKQVASGLLVPAKDAAMLIPARIGDYTDCYSSRYHATNVGIMFRGPENALKPNWVWLPVGYHGRASSVVVSGTPIRRPCGQVRPDEKAPPKFSACKAMDFELEMALFVGGPGNKLGEPISIDKAEDAIFGLTVMNDWSARDIQKWEYVPLGPFLGKNFATTISPWIVTLDALAPFRIANQKQEPAPLAYLQDKNLAAYDIKLQVDIQGEGMKAPETVSRSNAKYLYWSFTQQLTHHSVSGCNMRPGDLIGSGTISGPDPSEYGSMLELSWKGPGFKKCTKPVELSDGQKRFFLKDGDKVLMSGYCQGEGYRVGFGQCDGKILPANQ